MRARSRGNYRSAVQQKDSTTVTINAVERHTIDLAPGNNAGFKTLPVWLVLKDSQFYANYAPMYDQVKLVGVRAKINGAVQGTNVNAYLTPTVATAWDRNGLSQSLNVEQVYTYSSLITKAWSLGNSFVTTRSIYPSTMAEKSQYVATQSINNDATDVNNPCNPTQVQAIPFKPTLIVSISLPTGGLTTPQSFVWNIEFDITVKFRGLRKGLQPIPELPAGTITYPITVDGVSKAPLGSEPSGVVKFSTFTEATSTSFVIPAKETLAVIAEGTPYMIIVSNDSTNSINYTIPAKSKTKLLGSAENPFGVYYHTITNDFLPGAVLNPNNTNSNNVAYMTTPNSRYLYQL